MRNFPVTRSYDANRRARPPVWRRLLHAAMGEIDRSLRVTTVQRFISASQQTLWRRDQELLERNLSVPTSDRVAAVVWSVAESGATALGNCASIGTDVQHLVAMEWISNPHSGPNPGLPDESPLLLASYTDGVRISDENSILLSLMIPSGVRACCFVPSISNLEALLYVVTNEEPSIVQRFNPSTGLPISRLFLGFPINRLLWCVPECGRSSKGSLLAVTYQSIAVLSGSLNSISNISLDPTHSLPTDRIFLRSRSSIPVGVGVGRIWNLRDNNLCGTRGTADGDVIATPVSWSCGTHCVLPRFAVGYTPEIQQDHQDFDGWTSLGSDSWQDASGAGEPVLGVSLIGSTSNRVAFADTIVHGPQDFTILQSTKSQKRIGGIACCEDYLVITDDCGTTVRIYNVSTSTIQCATRCDLSTLPWWRGSDSVTSICMRSFAEGSGSPGLWVVLARVTGSISLLRAVSKVKRSETITIGQTSDRDVFPYHPLKEVRSFCLGWRREQWNPTLFLSEDQLWVAAKDGYVRIFGLTGLLCTSNARHKFPLALNLNLARRDSESRTPVERGFYRFCRQKNAVGTRLLGPGTAQGLCEHTVFSQ